MNLKVSKEYYIEYKDSMGFVLLHLGKFKSYTECRKAVNNYIGRMCVDNFYRNFRLYPKPLQMIFSFLSCAVPGSTKLRVRKLSKNEVNKDRYYCDITEMFR